MSLATTPSCAMRSSSTRPSPTRSRHSCTASETSSHQSTTCFGTPIARTTFDSHVGGHIYDVGEDGIECRWARVLAYAPPNRVVFAWDISPYWQVETNHD